MLKFSVVCLYFAVVAVNFWNVHCMSEENKKALMETMKSFGEDCGSECGITEEDYKKHKEGGDIDPCFKKCMMVKIGLMNEAGEYMQDKLHELIEKYAGNKEEAKKIQDKLDSCFDANGDNDGDDEESQMKRVDVLFKCLKEIKE